MSSFLVNKLDKFLWTNSFVGVGSFLFDEAIGLMEIYPLGYQFVVMGVDYTL